MNATSAYIWTRGLLTAVVAAAVALPSAASAGDADASVQEGKQLFVRRFVPGQPQPGGGDGLGPLFNNVSCAACHRQGAIGGGGDIEFNVNLLSAQRTSLLTRPAPTQKTLLAALRVLHPAFVTSDDKIVPAILVHRFGPGNRYLQLKSHLGVPEIPLEPNPAERDELQRQLASEPLPIATTKPPVQLVRAQRNTTALFGAGLIDQIPDEVLFELAAAQAKQGQVSGRVPPIGPDKVGRFGWRGQQEHLHDFVLGACANELGLQVPGNPQPMNPLLPKYRPKGLDLTAAQCESLTAFVASLPPPRMVEPAGAEQRAIVARGRKLFESVGCAACHVERIGSVENIFSDLLLHDMGPALADPVLAEATLVFVRQLSPEPDDLLTTATVKTTVPRAPRLEPPSQPSPPNNYYGGSSFQSLSLAGSPPTTVKIPDPVTGAQNEYRVQQTSLDREWRTSPLWGLADSAPYLHDGRAATVLEAITRHGGEADASKLRFFNLPSDDRLAMLEFLICLRAP